MIQDLSVQRRMVAAGLRSRIAVAIVAIAVAAVSNVPAPARSEPVDAARFYQLYDRAAAWSGSPEAQADARLVRSVLARAAEEGLDPARYADIAAADPQGPDTALTDALLTYMRDVAVGRPDLRSLDGDIGLPPRSIDAPALLASALRERRLATMLAGLPPRHDEYVLLRRALALDTVPDVRDRIAANMERWRWLPSSLEADRIVVNTAAATLELLLGGQRVLQSRVIVGQPKTPTPIMRAESGQVTVNPTWTVPHSIAAKEMLPKLKKNRRYLLQENMVLLNGPAGDPHGLAVNWRAIPAGSFPYRVQQLPGGKNALGRIKLELPNRFDVYLHDTPAPALFAREMRALSHGCVRVEQIVPLASYALADPKGADRIMALLTAPDTVRLPLKRKLPVYLLYWTAAADAQGRLASFPDIYGRDARLIAALKRPPALRLAARETGCARG
jgi:murein L,D-transpeptidase YcbB/YkuD